MVFTQNNKRIKVHVAAFHVWLETQSRTPKKDLNNTLVKPQFRDVKTSPIKMWRKLIILPLRRVQHPYDQQMCEDTFLYLDPTILKFCKMTTRKTIENASLHFF